MINWEALFTEAGTDYRTNGNNVARGNINIRCPFCADDPSYHFGINRQSNYYGCWRDIAHRGSNPFKFLSFMYGTKRAKELLSAHSAGHKTIYTERLDITRPPEVDLPNAIRPLVENAANVEPFLEYLKARRITPATALNYRLHFAFFGEYANRIIIPAINNGHEIMAFTARTILSDPEVVRYKALHDEQCMVAPREIVYGEHRVTLNTHVLIVCEGVFDIMRLAELLPDTHTPVAVNTNSLRTAQAARITKLCTTYNCPRVKIVFDRNSYGAALGAANRLAHLNAHAVKLPDNADDPAELDEASFLL